MLTLQYLFAVRGVPEHVRSDNGPEFIAKELQRCRLCLFPQFDRESMG